MKFVTGGGMRIDFLITHEDEARIEQIGGNALYAAVGAALWAEEVFLWARLGANYPSRWLAQLAGSGINGNGLVRLPEEQDHRTFFAYLPDGRRDDTNPAAHFARIGQPLPPLLQDYIHSTPGQDDPHRYEPLALRSADWPAEWTAVDAVHLSPLALATQLNLPPRLRNQGVRQITVDPGERYMIPERRAYIRQMMPHIDAFLPSRMEISSLFGTGAGVQETAVTLADWGAPLVVIKDGANGVYFYAKDEGRLRHLPPYHDPDDRRVIDVTGAGDSFCGGFMVGLARTGDPLQAAQYGAVSASLVIEGYGALYALTRRGETIARLAEMEQKR